VAISCFPSHHYPTPLDQRQKWLPKLLDEQESVAQTAAQLSKLDTFTREVSARGQKAITDLLRSISSSSSASSPPAPGAAALPPPASSSNGGAALTPLEVRARMALAV